MRPILILVLALLLESCSRNISLLIDNRSGLWVTVISSDETFQIGEGKAQVLPWPGSRSIVVSVHGCPRRFKLDEPLDQSRHSLVRHANTVVRYVVDTQGGLSAVRSDYDEVRPMRRQFQQMVRIAPTSLRCL